MTREEAILLFEISTPKECSECYKAHDFTCSGADARRCEAYRMAIAALREQGGSFQNGNDHNTVKDWPSYMDLPREQETVTNRNGLTNADHIRHMTDEELAEHNVQDSLEYTVDYDWDENPIGEYTPCFKTSDGAIFWSYEEAVAYELHWLKRPYKEDT